MGLVIKTDFFYTERYLFAEELYTSQHRYLAKYFISSYQLQQIATEYSHPTTIEVVSSRIKKPALSDSKARSVGFPLQSFTIKKDGFTAHEIIITNPSFVHLEMTLGGKDGRGLTLSESMKKYHAIAGINAGGFNDPGGDGNGGTPIGLTIVDGKLVHPKGYLFGTNQVIGLGQDGQWFMGSDSATYLLDHHVQSAIQFGPELIANGKILISGDNGWGYAPRTVIGQKANGNIVFWVNNGRWQGSVWNMGASLGQVAQILASQGVVNAFNLDGGGSTTMMIKKPGQSLVLVNHPATNNPPYGMRFLPDAFLVIPTR